MDEFPTNFFEFCICTILICLFIFGTLYFLNVDACFCIAHFSKPLTEIMTRYALDIKI